ncbi:MAG: hypothetical protein WCC60_15185, partial [Ilumatobacteraceae bacterium]
LGAGCGKQGLSRDDVQQRYVEVLTDSGIDPDVADCVITEFLGEMTDEELKVFNTQGDDLTAEQAARIGELAVSCQVNVAPA